jgi:hypothetical protein
LLYDEATGEATSRLRCNGHGARTGD